MKWFVYILVCSDNSYYVGHSQDIPSRVKLRNSGRGALQTSRNRPVRLAYSESLTTEAEAMHLEPQLKRRSRAKKEALISGNKTLIHELSKSND